MFRDDKIIRLRRKGHKHYAVYEIVVTKKYKRNRADYLEKLGFFNPNYKERLLFVNLNRLGFWLNKGASLHCTLKKHLSKFII